MKLRNLLLFTTLISIEGLAQDWQWLNPTPNGNVLNAIKYFDSTTAFAIGENGTILKSTNEGFDWVTQESGTKADLMSIAVIDKDTVYICGEHRTTLKSINGGRTWVKIFEEPFSSRNSNIIFFVSPSIGYIAGDGAALYMTSDYGATWENINTGLEFQNIKSFHFTNENTGYAIRSSQSNILKTTDGGLKWEEIILTIPFFSGNQISFLNDSIGFVTGSSGDIIKTSDFGENWTIVGEDITYRSLESIDFIDDSTVIIVGNGTNLKSLDAGDSWNIISNNTSFLSVSFRDSLNGIALGGNHIFDITGISITSNGGVTWEAISSTISRDNLNGIAFSTSDVGYVVGSDIGSTYGGRIIKTSDAGVNWTNIETGIQTRPIYKVAAPDDTTVYTVGSHGQILKSSDAGDTWAEQNSNTSEYLNDVQFLSTNVGYAIGQNGVILKTIDGGTTWINQNSKFSERLSNLHFLNKSEGYILGFDRDSLLILSTTDGGEKWDGKRVKSSDSPSDIFYLNSDTAFISAYRGRILRTIDGGNNWETTIFQSNGLSDIFFTTNKIGFIVGEEGSILKTQDCGENWKLITSGTANQLRSVHFTDINNGYVIGSFGTILKTTNGGKILTVPKQNSTIDFNIYPNPASTVINIDISHNYIGGIVKIINVYGQEVFNQKSSIGTTPINVQALSQGIYYVRLVFGYEILTKKILIE